MTETCEHEYIGPCAVCDGSGQLEPTWDYFLETEEGEAMTKHRFNLKQIAPTLPEFVFHCKNCRRKSESRTGYADLNGEAFKDYYCASCGLNLGNSQAHIDRLRAVGFPISKYVEQ